MPKTKTSPVESKSIAFQDIIKPLSSSLQKIDKEEFYKAIRLNFSKKLRGVFSEVKPGNKITSLFNELIQSLPAERESEEKELTDAILSEYDRSLSEEEIRLDLWMRKLPKNVRDQVASYNATFYRLTWQAICDHKGKFNQSVKDYFGNEYINEVIEKFGIDSVRFYLISSLQKALIESLEKSNPVFFKKIALLQIKYIKDNEIFFDTLKLLEDQRQFFSKEVMIKRKLDCLIRKFKSISVLLLKYPYFINEINLLRKLINIKDFVDDLPNIENRINDSIRKLELYEKMYNYRIVFNETWQILNEIPELGKIQKAYLNIYDQLVELNACPQLHSLWTSISNIIHQWNRKTYNIDYLQCQAAKDCAGIALEMLNILSQSDDTLVKQAGQYAYQDGIRSLSKLTNPDEIYALAIGIFKIAMLVRSPTNKQAINDLNYVIKRELSMPGRSNSKRFWSGAALIFLGVAIFTVSLASSAFTGGGSLAGVYFSYALIASATSGASASCGAGFMYANRKKSYAKTLSTFSKVAKKNLSDNEAVYNRLNVGGH